MSNLYNHFSELYEAMYQSFINYEDEFLFYSQILKQYACNEVVEIGCGTGNLCRQFTAHHFTYTGIDNSEPMLALARNKFPQGNFLQGDLRNFSLPVQAASVIITGRTISYLLSNKEVFDAFTSIYSNLKTKGILCFDFIDASRFIPQIDANKKITHYANVNGQIYQRDSVWSINDSYSWTFNWHSVFYSSDDAGNLVKPGEDHTVIRAFTKDDIQLFLELTGFEIKEVINRPSYAFDTFVIVAEKKS